MKPRVFTLAVVMLGAVFAAGAERHAPPPDAWPQWGQGPQHEGAAAVAGQAAARILASAVYDPFTAQEQNGSISDGELLVHYQTALVDSANSVYLEVKGGTYTDITTWGTQTWNEERLDWERGSLVRRWVFRSDWKPIPFGSAGEGGPSWEPVFHAALAGNFVYVPGFGGTVYKLAKNGGTVVAHILPFGRGAHPNIYLTGPLTVDAAGNLYFVAIQLDPANPYTADVIDSWLIKVDAAGHVRAATFASLTPGAPRGTDECPGTFDGSQLPWPPSPAAVPPDVQCGSQRPALNSAPAVAPDGTIYVASVAHLTSRTAYLLAVTPNLTPKWQASLRELFHDGCDVLIPPSGSAGGCAAGAPTGVDPAENRPGSGTIIADSTASPVVAPDGSILFGTYTRYNYAQGHLVKFSPGGEFLASYPFGWDDTPAIYRHGGTYSVITKDNHYGGLGAYCDGGPGCSPVRTAELPEAYYITQLSSDLVPEWHYQNTNQLSCSRNSQGQVTCTSTNPNGFEWCVNAPAVDRNGVIYANSEDGNLYVINQGGTLRDQLFLNLAIGAAYTPVALGTDGKIYSENFGSLFVAGD